jgi:homoisocitrate dehydrogenase
MSEEVTLHLRLGWIPGDGIGPEVLACAGRALAELFPPDGGVTIETCHLEAGWQSFESTGEALPANTLHELRSCDGALFGAVGSPSHRVEGYRSPIVALRKELDLFANLRPLQGNGIDVLIVRENTEGLYAGREHQPDPDTAITERVITRSASSRIARCAFEQALQRAAGRERPPRVTIVHKANVVRLGDGLFREAALAVGEEFQERYPELEIEEQLVDSMAYRLIREPQSFDVIVAPNLYGDILSDVGAALVGGLGLVPSANCSDVFCLAEPVHGSAPDIAGQGIANPIATLRATALLLGRLGQPATAQRLERAVQDTLTTSTQDQLTPDLGGTATSEALTSRVLSHLQPI